MPKEDKKPKKNKKEKLESENPRYEKQYEDPRKRPLPKPPLPERPLRHFLSPEMNGIRGKPNREKRPFRPLPPITETMERDRKEIGKNVKKIGKKVGSLRIKNQRVIKT